MGKRSRSILIVSVIVLAVLIAKAVLFFTAEPKITVDYVAEYNKTTRPQNVDPNENAAPYYQKAFDAFVEMPDELRNPYINWPTDYNSTEQALLEEWLTSNSHSFEYFRIAANKPYYWLERQASKDNSIFNITFPEMALLRQLIEAVIWDTKLDASKNQFQPAFEKILGCYRAGKHKCRPNLLLMEQHIGLRIKQDAIHAAMVILDKSKVDNKALEFLQDTLQQELDKDTYVPGSQAEKLWNYDTLQRTFLDNGKGTGRLWWRIGFDVVIPLSGGEGKIYGRKIKLSCFTGPTRKQVAEQIEQTSALFEHVITKTPWQIKDEGRDYFREIENINKHHFSLKILGIGIIDPKSIFYSYHKTRTQTDALIVVLAILQCKADTGQFPESLDELVPTGYLQSAPMDPYSSGPLVYKLTEDNFELYSVGKDFEDNGGLTSDTYALIPVWSGSGVGRPDILYWPVKRIERPPRYNNLNDY